MTIFQSKTVSRWVKRALLVNRLFVWVLAVLLLAGIGFVALWHPYTKTSSFKCPTAATTAHAGGCGSP